jgi:hypothetical protein
MDRPVLHVGADEAEIDSLRSTVAALDRRIDGLKGALRECIELEYYDGQMDPARRALLGGSPSDHDATRKADR